jgi:hypothetical protein
MAHACRISMRDGAEWIGRNDAQRTAAFHGFHPKSVIPLSASFGRCN